MPTWQIVGQAGSTRLAEQLNLPLRAVTPDYFEAMNIQIVDGRGFRPSDDADAPRVALINATFARRHFGGGYPLGRKVQFPGPNPKPIEIVGVVSDTRTDALNETAGPEIYFPLWQQHAFSKHLILHTRSDPRALGALVLRELHAVDPTAAVEHVKTMEDVRQESVASRLFAMRLLTAFAVTATALALVGLYGVLSLSVGARTKEIAVRKAIGARWQEIVRLVLREGYRLIACGVVLGLVLAVVLGRVLGALLYDVKAADPVTLVGAAALFGALAFVACAVPAWRAARVNLMDALRHQ